MVTYLKTWGGEDSGGYRFEVLGSLEAWKPISLLQRRKKQKNEWEWEG